MLTASTRILANALPQFETVTRALELRVHTLLRRNVTKFTCKKQLSMSLYSALVHTVSAIRWLYRWIEAVLIEGNLFHEPVERLALKSFSHGFLLSEVALRELVGALVDACQHTRFCIAHRRSSLVQVFLIYTVE